MDGVNSNDGVAIGAYAGGAVAGVGGTFIGCYSGGQSGTRSGARAICLGNSSGKYLTTQNDQFFVNNQDRTTFVGDQTLSILYGTMAATAAGQQLTVNGNLKINGGSIVKVNPQSAAYQITINDYLVSYTGADATLTLPASELITATNDRTFANTGNWTLGANWSIATGKLAHTSGSTAASSLATTNMGYAFVVGNTYTLQLDWVGNASICTIAAGGVTLLGAALNSTGVTLSYTFVATAVTALTLTPVTGYVGSIDNVSIRDASVGQELYVKHKGTGTLTIATVGADLIDGGANITLTTGQSAHLICDSIMSWSKV